MIQLPERTPFTVGSYLHAGDMEKAEFLSAVLNGNCGASAVSRLLQSRGFRKGEMIGSALTYDRQPVYRKAPAC